jgi:putative transposase
MEYRRLFIPGGTYFFTVVTFERRPIFSDPQAVEVLRDAFRYTLARMPYPIVADVILPDHMHFLWNLPSQTSDYSTRWRMIKSHFTRNWQPVDETRIPASRMKKGEAAIWQRRFWEHCIRDDLDLRNHVEYIHYNPVKHGLVDHPAKWKASSFLKYVRDGFYPEEWCADIQLSAIEDGID